MELESLLKAFLEIKASFSMEDHVKLNRIHEGFIRYHR